MVEVIEIEGRTFEMTGLVPYTRRDGAETTLYGWRAHCVHHGCTTTWCFNASALNRNGEMVAASDPSRHYAFGFKKQFCDEHRPQRRTGPNTYASRRLITDQEVAEMHSLAASFQGTRAALYGAASMAFGVTPGTAREILSGRKRPVLHHG
jgi:hypothetical protein